MIDISAKFPTRRTAVAEARVTISAATAARVKENDLPKKDPLIVARWAGIQAAKKTSELLPACHQVPLDHVDVRCELDAGAGCIMISADVKAEYKTGVEMEAMTAAAVAALTIYDMLKPVDETLVISEVRLVSKTGGINARAFPARPEEPYRAAVVIVSDSVSRGTREDKSGAAAVEILTTMGFSVDTTETVSDDPEQISLVLQALSKQPFALIVTTGGTGLGPRDSTDRIVRGLIEREATGIAEWIRAYGRKRTPNAILSNGVAGIRDNTLILTLPGSTAGVRESLEALRPTLLHALAMMRGEGH